MLKRFHLLRVYLDRHNSGYVHRWCRRIYSCICIYLLRFQGLRLKSRGPSVDRSTLSTNSNSDVYVVSFIIYEIKPHILWDYRAIF